MPLVSDEVVVLLEIFLKHGLAKSDLFYGLVRNWIRGIIVHGHLLNSKEARNCTNGFSIHCFLKTMNNINMMK